MNIHRGSSFALWLVVLSALLAATDSPRAQITVRSLTEVIEGHSVGGVTIDLVGNLYVADFADIVWKITPEGQRQEFASGFYGASGNAIDRDGNLLQANAYGDSIIKVDRRGHTEPFVTSGSGLDTPIGIAIDRPTGNVFVTNCRGNSITKIAPDRTTSTFAKSDLFRCPNGIAFGRSGDLYVVNFRDNRMLKIDPRGTVSSFATISDKGLGHLCFKDDRFYVTAHAAHALYEVKLDATVTRLLGQPGERGIVDGPDGTARLSFPNGIACDPWAPRLYINEYVNTSTSELPRRTIVREIRLDAGK